MPGLLFEEAALQITIGPLWTGAAPDFTGDTAVVIMGIAKQLEINQEWEKTDVHGAGSLSKQNRYHSLSGTVTMRNFIPSTGSYPVGSVTGLKHWVKVEHKTLSSLVTYDQYVGVVTKWQAEFSQGEGSMEIIEVDLNADHS